MFFIYKKENTKLIYIIKYIYKKNQISMITYIPLFISPSITIVLHIALILEF